MKFDPENEDLKEVKDVIVSFLIAWKNYALYPEEHAICRKAVENAAVRLTKYLESYGKLRLRVEKDRLLYGENIVFDSLAGAENMATLLFRDGILWAQFSAGITLDEVECFFKILKENQIWHENRDSDLVTAFWEADLPHLRYEVVDVYDGDGEVDFSNPQVIPQGNHHPMESESPEQDMPVGSDDGHENDFWELTTAEKEKLQKMIVDEGKRDHLSDLFFVLFVFSADREKSNEFKMTLKFLIDEFRESLLKGDFLFAYRFLNGLKQIGRTINKQNSKAVEALEQFFINVSGNEILNLISQFLEKTNPLDPKNIDQLKRLLVLLSPDAISAIGPMVTQNRCPYFRKKIREVVAEMARKDIAPLGPLMKSKDDEMVQALIPVLGQLEGTAPVQILLKSLRHSSAGVRQLAVAQLTDLNEGIMKRLFDLIEDPSDKVRKLIFEKLTRFRSATSEGLLLDYLQKKKYEIKTQEHLHLCYHALGSCGSHLSIPFLRRSLFGLGWRPVFGRFVHRQGAVVALMALETGEAEALLNKAAKSFFPNVKRAYKKAMAYS